MTNDLGRQLNIHGHGTNSYDEFRRKLRNGETLYAMNTLSDGTRSGTICKVSLVEELDYRGNKTGNFCSYKFRANYDEDTRSFEFYVGYNKGWVWLPDYSGPTVYKFVKGNRPKNIILDRFGNEIKVGDIVSYATKNGNTAIMYFGKVLKINGATVRCESFALDENDTVLSENVRNPNSCVAIIDESLFEALVLARLRS